MISISLLVVVVPGSVVEVDVVSWHCWRVLDDRPRNGNTFEERPIVVWIVGIWPFVWADNLKQHKVVRSCSQEKFNLDIFVTIRFVLIDQTVKADYPSSGSMTVPPPRTKTPAPFPFPTWSVEKLLEVTVIDHLKCTVAGKRHWKHFHSKNLWVWVQVSWYCVVPHLIPWAGLGLGWLFGLLLYCSTPEKSKQIVLIILRILSMLTMLINTIIPI